MVTTEVFDRDDEGGRDRGCIEELDKTKRRSN